MVSYGSPEIVGKELHMWFGQRDDPVLQFAPIDFSDVLLRE
jgi:hypothetical protein